MVDQIMLLLTGRPIHYLEKWQYDVYYHIASYCLLSYYHMFIIIYATKMSAAAGGL